MFKPTLTDFKRIKVWRNEDFQRSESWSHPSHPLETNAWRKIFYFKEKSLGRTWGEVFWELTEVHETEVSMGCWYRKGERTVDPSHVILELRQFGVRENWWVVKWKHPKPVSSKHLLRLAPGHSPRSYEGRGLAWKSGTCFSNPSKGPGKSLWVWKKLHFGERGT